MRLGIFDVFSEEGSSEIYLDESFFAPFQGSTSGNLLSLIKESGFFQIGGEMTSFYPKDMIIRREHSLLLEVEVNEKLLETAKFIRHFSTKRNDSHRLNPSCLHCWNFSHVGLVNKKGEPLSKEDRKKVLLALGATGKITPIA